MKQALKILTLAALIVNMLACAQKAGSKKFVGGPAEFKPMTSDTKLNREQISNKTASDLLLLAPGAYYLNSSPEILELAETLLDLANLESDGSKKQALINMSERVRAAYYTNSKNFTKFDQNSTAYLELALGLAYDGPKGLQNTIYGKMNEQESTLGQALEKIQLDLKPQKVVLPRVTPNVLTTITDFEDFLRSVPVTLKNEKVGEEVVASVKNTLTANYLPLLASAKSVLADLKLASSPTKNIEIIETAVNGFTILPKTFVEPIISKLAPVKKMATKIASSKNPDEMFDVLFDLWSDPTKRDKIKDASQALYDLFSSMTPEQITWLRNYNLQVIQKKENLQTADWKAKASAWYTDNLTLSPDKAARAYSSKTSDPYVLTFKLWYAKGELEKIGVPVIVHNIERAINIALLTEFDGGLRVSSKLLAKTVREKIARDAGLKFLDYRNNLKDILREKGRLELGKRVFAQKPTFVAIEDSRAALMMNKQNKFITETNASVFAGKLPSGAVVSSAKTLGLALSLQAKRLQQAESNTLSKKSAQYFEEVFTPVNKMMAIAGFKYMEEEKPRFVGLFRLVNGESDNHDMDIFNYDLEKSTFAIPENIVISKNFLVAKNTTGELGLNSTVEGNAEIVRGGANMMRYFRDWVQNGYDVAIANEEFQKVKIFPKEAFYALSMGVGSVPLRNLTREGLVGYTLSGETKAAATFGAPADYTTEECPKSNDKDPVTSAALMNVSPGGRGDIIKSADIARFILAADTFIDSSEGAEDSKAAALQKVENGMKPTLKAIRCGQKSLKTLMMGLANFLSAKMQLPDGGFASQYSLEQKAIVPDISKSIKGEQSFKNRYLEDQLLIIQALRKVFDRWQGQAYANLAADSYHFMNTTLFDGGLGFYKVSEKSIETQKVDLRLMSMTLETLKMLEPMVPVEDRDQLQFLVRTWSQKLQDFTGLVAK